MIAFVSCVNLQKTYLFHEVRTVKPIKADLFSDFSPVSKQLEFFFVLLSESIQTEHKTYLFGTDGADATIQN